MPAFLLALLPILSGVLDKVIPDPEAKAKAMADIMAQAQQADLAQMEVNKAEAQTGNMFIAGWRPFIGWVCGVALAYQYILLPLGGFVSSFFGEVYVTAVLNAPRLDSYLWELISAMLGMGGLRTIEKIKGVSR